MADLKEADEILGKYMVVAQRAANELARLKSFHVFGRIGCYRPHLGCYEAGRDTICLHLRDGFRKKVLAFVRIENRAIDFELAWSRRCHEVGIRNVHISGHY